MLHELVDMAEVKPSSKLQDVYRHSGGGRGRTPVTLQARTVGMIYQGGEGGSRNSFVFGDPSYE